jgi:hypothetical protein
VLLILALAGGASSAAGADAEGDTRRVSGEEHTDWPLHRLVPPRSGTAPAAESMAAPRNSAPAMALAADVCTEIARAREAADLKRALGRAAEAMDASGLVVWAATAAGGDLWPVLAHGYPTQTLARMAPVPRSGDNATAAAYRSGTLQIVLSRPGVSSGALAAPLLSPDGCIGALTAEIEGRSETSDGVQALAALVAAQFATILSTQTASGSEAADLPVEKSATA